MNLSTRISIPKDVIARQVGEETVMLDLAKGAYFGLDPIGARIWQLLADGKTPAEACDLMAEEYDVARDQVERDLVTLLDNLKAHGLIVQA